MRTLRLLSTLFAAASASAQGDIETIWTFEAASYDRIALSEDLRFIAGKAGGDAAIEIRSVEDRRLVAALQANGGNHPADVRFSPDGRFIAVSDYDRTVRVWDVEMQEQVRTFQTWQQYQPVSFSHDSKYLFFGNGRIIEKWALPKLDMSESWNAYSGGWVASMAVSPNGSVIATGAGSRGDSADVRIWSVNSSDLNLDLSTSLSNGVRYLAYSFDGTLIATYREFGSGPLEIWNAADGMRMSQFQAYSYTQDVSFSGDGNAIFTSAHRVERIEKAQIEWNEVSLWDWKTGFLMTAFPGIANVVSFRGSDEFLYLTPEGHLTRARLPLWLRPPNVTSDGVSFEWLGREGIFQLQRRGVLEDEWENIGEPTSARSATVTAEGASGFFRLVEVE